MLAHRWLIMLAHRWLIMLAHRWLIMLAHRWLITLVHRWPTVTGSQVANSTLCIGTCYVCYKGCFIGGLLEGFFMF